MTEVLPDKIIDLYTDIKKLTEDVVSAEEQVAEVKRLTEDVVFEAEQAAEKARSDDFRFLAEAARHWLITEEHEIGL